MTTLFVKKVDESTLRYDSDEEGLLYELNDYFSFLTPNYKYDRRFQNHLWDGMIHLCPPKRKTTMFGLYHRIEQFCHERGYEFVDQTEPSKIIRGSNPDEVEGLVETLNLPFTPRSYQMDAVKFAVENNRGILVSPTGSGKSLILYILLRWHYAKGRKICLIVPSTSLVEQMISDFAEYSEDDPSFNAREIIKPLYSGTGTDPFEEQVVVSTWQSLMHYDKELMESWDVVLNDEVHGAQSKVVSDIIGKAKNAPYKIGTTGSLSGKDMHEFILTGLFGKIYQVTTTKDLQDEGTLSKMRIFMITLKHNKDAVKSFYNTIYNETHKKPSYAEEVEYLCDDSRRQKFVRNLACACKGVTMVLFNRKKQGIDLFNMIKEKVGDTRAVFHIDGEVDAETREKIRQEILEKNDAILIFSVGTSATGINIPSIANVILCPSKSRIRNLQSIGRGLRLSKGKDVATIFDIVDDFSSYRRIKSYSVKHGMERYSLYQEQGFDIAFKTIDF